MVGYGYSCEGGVRGWWSHPGEMEMELDAHPGGGGGGVVRNG
jgi:hypothetical protein